MNIYIFRRRFTPWGVDGTMVITVSFSADTLERPQRYLKADVTRCLLFRTKHTKVSETKKKIV